MIVSRTTSWARASGCIAALGVVVVAALAIAYVIILASLGNQLLREAGLKSRLRDASTRLEAAQKAQSTTVETLRQQLAQAEAQQKALQEKFPKDLQTNAIYDRVLSTVRKNGLTDLRFQRKSDIVETMPSSRYKVARFTIQVKGTMERLLQLVADLDREFGPVSYLDDISLFPAGSLWELSVDIVLYQQGG